MLRAIRSRLTYANVIATLALFLALGGGAVWAATKTSQKIGPGRLKPNAVTAGKIKANAVTQTKIRANAVTGAKIREGAVDLSKIAAGTNVVTVSTSVPAPVNTATAVNLTFPTPASFTPVANAVYMMNVEARSTNLARTGPESTCRAVVYPVVNGAEWSGSNLTLSAFEPTPEEPGGVVPAAGRTSPIGLAAVGQTQTIGANLIGSAGCSPASTVSVVVAITELK